MFPYPRRRRRLNVVSPVVKLAFVALWMVNPVSFMELSVQVKLTLGLLALPVHCSSEARRCLRWNRKHQRVHHVHLFMGENVAVPHVLPAEVDVVVEDLRDRDSIRVEPSRGWRWDKRGPLRQRRVDQADAVGHLERDLRRSRNGRPHREVGDLQRVHPEGVFPAQLDGVHRRPYDLPALVNAVDELSMEQVGVDGVGIHAVVEDPPDLCAVGHHPDWSPLH